MRKPTLAAAMENRSKFSEDIDPALSKGVDNASPALAAVHNLHAADPKTRADVGGKFGGAIGLGLHGPVGMLIGSAVGAVAGRAAGLVKSGEHEDNQRIGKMAETLNTMGLLNEDGTMKFEKGDKALFLPPPGTKLKNMSTSVVTGVKDRTITEVDKSNPFSRRTNLVARPLARYIAQGIMGYKNPKSEQDKKAVDNLSGMLTNSFQDKANHIDIPYGRAKSLVKKLGVNQVKMRSFFNNLKSQIPEDEAEDIKRGLDILYGGE